MNTFEYCQNCAPRQLVMIRFICRDVMMHANEHGQEIAVAGAWYECPVCHSSKFMSDNEIAVVPPVRKTAYTERPE